MVGLARKGKQTTQTGGFRLEMKGKGLESQGQDMLPFSILYGLMKNDMGLVSRGEAGSTGIWISFHGERENRTFSVTSFRTLTLKGSR